MATLQLVREQPVIPEDWADQLTKTDEPLADAESVPTSLLPIPVLLHVALQLKLFPEFVVSAKLTVPPPVPANVTVSFFAAATYTGVAPGVGVFATVGVDCAGRGAPRARATLIRPKVCPFTGSAVPRIW